MKMVMSFGDDEVETAQRMLDWHVYYVACANVATYCREQLKVNGELDMVLMDILAMVAFVEKDDVAL